MRLANPFFLLFLIPIMILAFLYLKNKIGQEASLRFSSLDLIRSAGGYGIPLRRILSTFLRVLVLVLLVIALARPQAGRGEREEVKNVVDVMLSIDTSSSMATLDFHPDNRLEAAKLEAKRFIEQRPYDRVGLVIFSKQSITQCPLTTDRAALLSLLQKIQIGTLEDGTAIGVGLANAINRLKDTEAKSKVVILLTDGINNSGEIDPVTAAEIAKSLNIRVYTIGMGMDGDALLPINDPRFGRRLVRVNTQIDEKTLRDISEMTGGLYFRARDEGALRSIFDEINKLEKTEIKVNTFTRYEDRFQIFLWLSLFVLLFELCLMNLVFQKVP